MLVDYHKSESISSDKEVDTRVAQFYVVWVSKSQLLIADG